MKVVIVGGVAAGATLATALRRKGPDIDIVMFEKDRDFSFSNCSIPYSLSGIIENTKDLINRTKDDFKYKNNIDARNHQLVEKINRKEKSVEVKDLITQKTYKESYDYLVLATGASSIELDFEGSKQNNVFTLRNVEDLEKIKNYVNINNSKKVLAIGGGFISIEAIENMVESGMDATIVSHGDEVLSQIDTELKGVIHNNLKKHNVKLIFDNSVEKIEGKKVTFTNSTIEEFDVILMTVGMLPNSKLAKDCGLKLTERGFIDVDRNFKTSDDSIFAAGDAVSVYNTVSRKKQNLMLAWPAHRQAKQIADTIVGNSHLYEGVIGTFQLRSFDINIASTGLSENELIKNSFEYDTAIIRANDRVSHMPNSKEIYIKLLFDKFTGELYGAQAVGEGDVDKRIDVCASVIRYKGNVYDIERLELGYSPVYSTTEDALNTAGAMASEILDRNIKQLKMREVDEKIKNFDLIDIRNKEEFEKLSFKNSKNLKLSDIRNYINKEKNTLIVDERGYSASNLLKSLSKEGFDNVYMLQGGFDLFKNFAEIKKLDLFN
ncbi:MAG: FAD-dependent oxidoreductase [Peptoniphilaceae bacterium]|nr:FAD-dependent oxidoreductase [Peptoniphilaceae bacterium]MDY3738598.1 FAD-dependent oxidoreductase [Peptoniphilaceae bacterium]